MGTVGRIRDSNVSVTRCSVVFLGPVSRRLLRRINGEFDHIVAIRGNMVGNKLNDTILRFVTSGKCTPRMGQVNIPSRFIRRKSVPRLCGLYNVSTGDVTKRVGGVIVEKWCVLVVGLLCGVGVVVTKTNRMKARLTGVLSRRGRSVVLVSPGRRHLGFAGSDVRVLPVINGPASVQSLRRTNVEGTSLFIDIAPRRAAGITTDVLTSGLKTRGALTHVGGCRCLLPGGGRLFRGVKVSSVVCPRVLTTGRVIATIEHP